MTTLKAIQADITGLAVDAIVNAANTTLHGGGGVDGAIHRAAGRELDEACLRLGGCRTGDAKITPGFRLPAKFIIHTVGPVWRDGTRGEAELLASCYRRSLEIAEQRRLTSIAFPAISTGIYGYPILEATEIAVATARDFCKDAKSLHEIIFCCFSSADYQIYQDLLSQKSKGQRTKPKTKAVRKNPPIKRKGTSRA